VTNAGGDTPPLQSRWTDSIYLSADQSLDINSDRYLGSFAHTGGLAAGASYTITDNVTLPTNLTGPYYLIAVTNPSSITGRSAVFESNGFNNALATSTPILLDLPPPSDLVINSITNQTTAKIGDQITISWTGSNQGANPASGTWTDAVYLSSTPVWTINAALLGHVSYTGTLTTGQTYTSTLTATVPPVKLGQYYIIVRTNIYNTIYEGPFNGEAALNNFTTAANTLSVDVDPIQLGVPYQTTLSTGQSRLYRVTVPQGETLQVSLTSPASAALNELFLRYNDVPSGFQYDAIYQDALQANQTAVIPTTKPGDYYILIRGDQEPAAGTSVTITSQLLPLAITNVVQDQGGDSKWVTFDITGAQFSPNAIVKLVRPDIAEYEPVNYQVLDSTRIVTTFDFTGAPHGLYDLEVINPDGNIAIEPYRYLIERALQPDVTIGVGGPRVILAGDTGTYSISFQSLTNVDTPYVYFTYGTPEMGTNGLLYNLPYTTMATNLGGQPDKTNGAGIPWAGLQSTVNTAGENLAPGYLFNVPAGGTTAVTFNLATYPGLQALHDHNWDAILKAILSDSDISGNLTSDQLAALKAGPHGLDAVYPGLYNLYVQFAAIPDLCLYPFIPFRTNIVASATPMTRDEFIAQQDVEAEALRQRVLADSTANPALINLASDTDTWQMGWLGALEEAGLLLPADQAPPIRSDIKVQSLMSVLATGFLYGPAGGQVMSNGDLLSFFTQVEKWYGSTPGQIGAIDHYDDRFSELCGLEEAIPVPALAQYSTYNLDLSHPTYLENFNVYVPWVPFEDRGAAGGTVAVPEFGSLAASTTGSALDFSQYFQQTGAVGDLATITGPQGFGTQQFIPSGQALPYTINFANSDTAQTEPGEIRIVQKLDPNLDPGTFRLGDLTIGDINVHIPSDRALFQGDFDFTHSKGFILRVSAGIDTTSATATWLLQAIDPNTGEVIQNPSLGLLPPNNAEGAGRGIVSYTVQALPDLPSGTTISAQARVLFNTMAPLDTATLTQTLDSTAPTTTLTATQIAGTSDYNVQWTATDEVGGSGVAHVTVYVSEDGRDYNIWLRQTTDTSGIYQGQAGHTYQFLALATDNAGNTEKPPAGVAAPNDGSTPNLGGLPNVTTTPVDVTPPPAPTPPTNSLLIGAEQGVPAPTPLASASEFGTVIAPFDAQAFATGIPQSEGGIGPLAIVATPDGGILASGGANRGSLYKFGHDGGIAGTPLATLDEPIFNMAFDKNGELWATTGGGPLLLLNPQTGAVAASFGDSITQSLAVDPSTDLIYVSSGKGIEIFDPIKHTFTHFSDVRVDDLAFAPDGSLWGTSWPDRGNILKFNSKGRAQVMVHLDSEVDSIVFGQPGSSLAGILFASNNSGPAPNGSTLVGIDEATLQPVVIALKGTRGETLVTTSDGRLFIAQSHQIDVVNPIVSPHVAFVNPANGAIVPLPMTKIEVTFDHDMLAGDGTDPASVLNLANYALTQSTGAAVTINSAQYDAATRKVTLSFDPIAAGAYTLTIYHLVKSLENVALQADYITSFFAVSDLSGLVSVVFNDVRSSRADGTVSYDVTVTNTSSNNIDAPVTLVLDPGQYFQGQPTGAATQTSVGWWLIDLGAGLTGGVLRPGQSTTAQTITVTNPLGQHLSIGNSVFAMPTPTQSPVFDSSPVTAATAGETYQYQLAAHDPNGYALTYVLFDAPAGMTLDPATATLSWSPTAASPAQVNVVVAVYDIFGASASQAFAIDVAGGNQAPVVQDLPAQASTPEGTAYAIGISATDPDGDALTYFANHLPPGAIFDPTTNQLEWTPGPGSPGTYPNITLGVSDGVNTVTKSFTLQVTPVNQPATLTPVPDRTVREGDPIHIQLRASDPEGDPLTYSSPLLPPGALLDPNTGVFEWTPSYTQAGVYTAPFHVSDGTNDTVINTIFTVVNANVAPIFDQLGPYTTLENQVLSFRAFAFDPHNPGFVPQDRLTNGQLTQLDGTDPSVTYTVSGLPTGATFDPVTAMFNWDPAYEQAGQYTVHFTATASDGDGITPMTSALDVVINVADVNRPPVVPNLTDQTVAIGQTLSLPIAVTDPDNEPVAFTVLLSRQPTNGIGAVDTTPFALGPNSGFATLVQNPDGTYALQFAPGDGNSGNYQVTLKAADSGDEGGAAAVLTATSSFILSVPLANERPVFDYIGDKVAVAGQPLSFIVQARDPTQDALTFAGDNLPAGMTITPLAFYGEARIDWTPGSGDLGSHTITLHVTDPTNSGTDAQSLNIVVRTTNQAPVLLPVGDQTLSENQPFALQLKAVDPDNDPITFSAANLPLGASLDGKTGLLTWTPHYFTAGDYPGVVLTASDGNLSSSETVTLHVQHVDRAPEFVPMATQSGREGADITFKVIAADSDQDPVVYSMLSALPAGAFFNRTTGVFDWTPNYDQEGQYVLKFGATDPNGSQATLAVTVTIANTDRPPTISASNHQVVLGQPLSFTFNGADPDVNDTLTYTAKGLPDGAILDPQSGKIQWTPSAGQAGEYLVLATVSDGTLTATTPLVLRATTAPLLPSVVIVETPSFPAVSGQDVLLHVAATGFADIASLAVTVNGKPVTLDSQGRAHITAGQPGKMTIVATATDADGLVGTASSVIKIKDPTDLVAPVVSFANQIFGAQIAQATNILGSVDSTNLDYWTLEIAPYGSSAFTTIAQGGSALDNAALVHLDPAQYLNGFYTLRLTAADVAGRTAQALSQIEIDSEIKTGSYARTDTDLTATLDGHTVAISRQYDSLGRGDPGTFGYGWRLTLRDTDIQSNAPLAGRESFGDFSPFQEGTRVYTTLPDGERVGFTFEPVAHKIPGLVYYTPAFVSDPGVSWTLQSANAQLTRVGSRFYDLQTGAPYNPAAITTGPQYTLVAPDGTAYEIDSSLDVTGIDFTDGVRLIVSDSGIYAPNGDTVTFVGGASGIAKAIGSNGDQVVYLYDAQGNLTLARDLFSGASYRYGYDSAHRLTLVTGGIGSLGTSIDPQTGATSPVTADLGSATSYLENSYAGALVAGATDQLTFTVRQSELQATASGSIYFGVVVSADGSSLNPAIPVIADATLVAGSASGGSAFGLYKLDHAGLELIRIAGADSQTSGAYKLQLYVAGDVNHDGKVDGTDANFAFAAMGTATGQAGYLAAADFDQDGKIDATDTELLFQDLGYHANQPPVATNDSATTHQDLATQLDPQQYISDPEGDQTFYRIVAATDGTATLSSDGKGVVFTPAAGFVGQASFSLVADDGYSTSAVATVTVNISNAALVRINLPDIGPLTTGDTLKLQITGDFTDATGVPLPASYLTLSSSNPALLAISSDGAVSALNSGSAVITAASHGIIGVRALLIQSPADVNSSTGEAPAIPVVSVYPQALTLAAGTGQRQLVVTDDSGADISSPDSGTLYFSSNSSIVTVSATGLVTAHATGQATVSILNLGGQTDIPVLVEEPLANGAQIGSGGGVVSASDGSTVSIGPRVLSESHAISIASFGMDSLPLPMPDPSFQFAAGFSLDLGGATLSAPAQLTVPTSLAAGSKVYFFQQAEIPIGAGQVQNSWLLVDDGVVGSDGMARTSSPPYPGITSTGKYIVALAANVSNVLVSLNGAFNAYGTVTTQAGSFAIPFFAGLSISIPVPSISELVAYFKDYITSAIQSISTILNPQVPFVSWQIPAQTQNLPIPTIIGDPIINSDGTITLNGANFGTDASLTTVLFNGVAQTPTAISDTSITVPIPVANDPRFSNGKQHDAVLGLADISVQRTYHNSIMHPTPTGPLVKNNLSAFDTKVQSNVVRPQMNPDVMLVAMRGPHALNAIQISTGAIIKSIDLNQGETMAPWYGLVLSPDKTRAYVALMSGGIAVIDMARLKEVDKVNIPGGGGVSSLAIDPFGKYLYAAATAAAGGNSSIYAISIDRPNPASATSTYDQVVATIPILGAESGINGMAVSSDGKWLFAAVPITTLYGNSNGNRYTSSGGANNKQGSVAVIDINPADGSLFRTLIKSSASPKVGTIQVGLEPTDITTTSDPTKFSVSDRLDVFHGFVPITITSNSATAFGWQVPAAIQLGLDNQTNYNEVGVHNATAVAFTPDLKFAFVADYRLPTFVASIDGNDTLYRNVGGKVGVIQDPFGTNPRFLGSTNDNQDIFLSSLLLSPDGTRLYAGGAGFGSNGYTLEVFSAQNLESAALAAVSLRQPLEFIDAAVDLPLLSLTGPGIEIAGQQPIAQTVSVGDGNLEILYQSTYRRCF
jgi:YD repeat-containing protein